MKKIVSGLGIIGVGGWVDAIEPGGWTGGRSQGGAGEEGGTSASARPGQARPGRSRSHAAQFAWISFLKGETWKCRKTQARALPMLLLFIQERIARVIFKV